MKHKGNGRNTSDAETASPARLWRVVLARDARWDGRFVYAVRSTRIYCRPSCASRRPRRTQVEFFNEPGQAEAAGFRACRRCEPRDAARVGNTSSSRLAAERALAAEVCSRIESHLDEPLRLATLAAEAHLTSDRLHRAFRRVTGTTPRRYAEALRLGRLKKNLREGNNVTTALYDAGFSSSSRLYEHSDAQLGMTPATYRRGGRGMAIRFTITDCPLGRILVAATSRGVSAVYFGDSDRALEAALHKEYPEAQIEREPRAVSAWLAEIVRHLGGHQPSLELPTDVAATAFQQRVWSALRRIPYGTTRTYSQIARELGRPTATRAVARACATNPTSIVVPCHRVVREDGNLAGYRWGIDRKSSLVAREREFAAHNRPKSDAHSTTQKRALAARV